WRGPTARGEWVERVHDGLAQNLRDRDVADGHWAMVQRQLASASDYAQALTREVGRKEADLELAQRTLSEMTSAAEAAHLSWLAERESMQHERESMRQQLELVEQRAATAEQWAAVLAREIERKEADLVIAHTALEVAARRDEEKV